MNIQELQYAIGTSADGKWSPGSRAALIAAFTNPAAPAVTDSDIDEFAARLGCTASQIKAVSAVESSGSGFDGKGRPKILFERHLFHRLTDGRYSPTAFSQASGGGYSENSWDKLIDACGRDPDAAFSAVSWGKFQVLGLHWSKLGYASPFELARSTVIGERAHYELLCRYVETFGLKPSLRKISADPETCRDFARLYNGAGYVKFAYHTRIAKEMR